MDEYRASAFHPKFDDGRESGTLMVRHDGIRFVAGRASVDLPFSGMELRVGGASDRLIFFSHPARPGWSIYTDDRTILSNTSLREAAALAPALRRIRRSRAKSWAITLVVFAALIAALWGLLHLKDPLVAVLARRVPPAVERKIGEVGLRQIALSKSTISDERIVEPMRKLLEPIARAAASTRYRYELNVVDDPAVNAFALPGGPIVLNSGLILAARSPEEIAGVVGHEIAHITEQHSVEQIISSLGVFAIVQAMFGDISGLAAVIIDGGARLVTMSFSREAEREADEVGLKYLAAAKIDPRGMLSFFETLREQEGVAGAPALALLSTHPATDDRIRHLEARIRRLGGGPWRTPDIDLPAVQKAIRSEQERRKGTDAGSS